MYAVCFQKGLLLGSLPKSKYYILGKEPKSLTFLDRM